MLMSTYRTSNLLKRMIDIDANICLKFNQTSHWPGVACFFSTISRLGDGIIWYIVMLLLPIIYGWQAIAAALHMFVVGLITLAVYKIVKKLTGRQRPCTRHNNVNLAAPMLDQYSFPSGHTMHAVSFTVIATSYFPDLAILLYPFTVLVALSRMILGLHYPTDVLIGVILGAGIASFSLNI